MQDISLHLLDMVENSTRAGAANVHITIIADMTRNKLEFIVKDDGSGMDAETVSRAQDPFYTSKSERTKKVGLGIPLFKQNAEACDGGLEIVSSPGQGTEIRTVFRFDHIDRMPLGNLADTMLSAVIGHPESDFHLDLKRIGFSGTSDFHFDTPALKEELGDIPLSYPDVIDFITGTLNEGVEAVGFGEI